MLPPKIRQQTSAWAEHRFSLRSSIRCRNPRRSGQGSRRHEELTRRICGRDGRGYTLAFTCQAAQDNPDQADAAVTFSPVESAITVTAGQTTTVDLP
jgi:hypothetical protein